MSQTSNMQQSDKSKRVLLVDFKASSNREELAPKQQRALIALLSSNTIADAAKACRMNEATLYRLLRDDAFKAQYRLARSVIVEHAIAQLQRDCETATRTLRDICNDEKAQASARVSAAKTIIDGAVKAVELADLAQRIEELEEKSSTKK